jgi:hypothetical protein
MRLRPLALIAAAIVPLALALAGPGRAGTLTCSGAACSGSYSAATYANANCPAAPEVPHLKSGDKASYDRSVEAAKAYSDAAAARLNCIIDEANKDAEQIQAAIQAGVKQQRDDDQAKLSAVQTALNNLPRH